MNNTSRRQLFRNGLLALLTGGTAAALRKRQRLVAQGKCVGQGICRGCDVLDDCGLPRALSMKQVLARQHDG